MADKNISEVEELRKKVILYEKILDMITEGVFITDPKGSIVYINKFSAIMENLDRDYIIGRNQYDTGVDTKSFSADMETLKTHPVDGSRYFFYSGSSARMANTYPFYYNGKLKNYFSHCYFIDHTKI